MSSDFETILGQVATTLNSLGTGLTVKTRKRFITHANDTFPLAIIIPQAEREEDASDQFECSHYMDYPVMVAIVLANGQTLGDPSTMLTHRQTIRRALRSVKVAHPLDAPCVNVRADLDPPFDKSSLEENLDATAMIFTYTIQEPRSV